jgi:hypothetical protein
MQQSGTIILDYKKANSLGGAYWHGNVFGREMKFVRVLCGLAVPHLDREAAAVIAIGELLRGFAPPVFHGLSAATGSWPAVKGALSQLCRDLKPDNIICENEQSRRLVWPITDALVGQLPFNVLSSVAPPQATTELGRQNVDQLLAEDRLHIRHLLDVLDSEKESADRALRCAINYALEFTAFYPGKPRGPLKLQRILGTEGL